MLMKVKSTVNVWSMNFSVPNNVTSKYKQWNLFINKENFIKTQFLWQLATQALTK